MDTKRVRTSKLDIVIAEFNSFELKDAKARYFRDCAVKYIELLADRLDDLGIKSIKNALAGRIRSRTLEITQLNHNTKREGKAMMVVGENTVSISTIEYEALVESRVKLCIVDRLVRNEKEDFIDGEAIRAVLGIEKKKKVFGND